MTAYSKVLGRLLCVGMSLGFFGYAHAQPVSAQWPFDYSYSALAMRWNAGDQVKPCVAMGTNGGYMVWQDNATDGNGLGISGLKLDASFRGVGDRFAINTVINGDQCSPKVALLKDGGAVIVWQSRDEVNNWNIRGAFFSANGVNVSGDIIINTYKTGDQINPSVCVLNNGNVVVAWASEGQDGYMYGIIGRIFTATGQTIGTEFQLNSIVQLNQNYPVVAPFGGDKFVAAWICETPAPTVTNEEFTVVTDTNTQSMVYNVIYAHLYGRYFSTNGVADGTEFDIGATDEVCSGPAITATATGGFAVTWVKQSAIFRDQLVSATKQVNGCDIFARIYGINKQSLSMPFRVNSNIYGDQYEPTITAGSDGVFIAWTSLGQDGSDTGVYGRFFDRFAQPMSAELAINQMTEATQQFPSVASNGRTGFLVAWSGYVSAVAGMDLFAQNYVTAPVSPTAPSLPAVYASGSQSLVVSWASEANANLLGYLVYVDGTNSTPLFSSTNYLVVSNLAPGSVHAVHFAYQLTDYSVSLLAGPVTGQTWGIDITGAYGMPDILPDDWQRKFWGSNPALWPAGHVDSDGDGVSNYFEYLAGTDPTDKNSCLKVKTEKTPQGMKVLWNVAPGQQYQLQISTNLSGSVPWQNLGNVRFASSTNDWVMDYHADGTVFYRVMLMR